MVDSKWEAEDWCDDSHNEVDKYFDFSTQDVAMMEIAYKKAKAAKVGEKITCPTCGKEFTKKSYQQAFCRNKGRDNCKDGYWNFVKNK